MHQSGNTGDEAPRGDEGFAEPEKREPLPPGRIKHLRTERPQTPPPLGGTLDPPEHRNPSSEPLLPAPRWAKIAVGGLLVFGGLNAALWIAGELGGRRTLALISSVLLLVGVLFIRYARPTTGFIRELQRQRHRKGLPVDGRNDLLREQLRFRLLTGGTLVLLATAGFALALMG